jgi:hypothetical protein
MVMYQTLRHTSRTRGLRHAARPRIADDSATFDGVYLRPSVDNGGNVPASGNLCFSPDIWISGTTPINPATLATTDSYGQISQDNIAFGQTNFIYVRAANGTTAPLSRTVQLYYAPSSVIQWPSNWMNNLIPTDQTDAQGHPALITNITNLGAGAIGVADNVFQWANVPELPAGADHYCLFAQLNDANNSNPFPDPMTQIDMAVLIKNNLAWGWRNTAEVAGNVASWSNQVGLNVPANQPAGQYRLFVMPSAGYIGWSVAFQCSQNGADGQPISMPPTLITSAGQLAGITCNLNPGFNASITVSMFQNGAPASPTGSKISLTATYFPKTGQEVTRAIGAGLVDWRLQQRLRNAFGGITPLPEIALGAQHYKVGPAASANRRSQ